MTHSGPRGLFDHFVSAELGYVKGENLVRAPIGRGGGSRAASKTTAFWKQLARHCSSSSIGTKEDVNWTGLKHRAAIHQAGREPQRIAIGLVVCTNLFELRKQV